MSIPVQIEDIVDSAVNGGTSHDLYGQEQQEHVPDHPPAPYPSIDQPLAVARRLVADIFTHNENRTLTRWQGDWWMWQGAFWKLVDDREALDVKEPIWMHLEQAVVKEKGDDEGEPVYRPWKPTTARINNLMEPLAIHTRINGVSDAPLWLDHTTRPPAKSIISMKNGLLNLQTMKMQSHTPALFNTWALGFDYDPQATCPTWESFLEDVFEHDAAASLLLQEYAGYLISGRTDIHKALLIVGPGRSGKGTISRTLKQLVGVGNTVSPSLNSLGSEFGLAELIGKPLAIVEDARGDDDRRNNTTVERLLNITGEDALSINRKGISYWNGTLPTRFLLVSNETPRFLDSSGAILNRFMSMKLHKSYANNPDTTLGSRINAEMSGIFNWALEGLEKLNEQGNFTRPLTMDEMNDLMGDLASPVAKFLDENYEITGKEDDYLQLKEVHRNFKAWCEEVESKSMNQETFTQRVVATDPLISFKNTRLPGHTKKDRWLLGLKNSDW